MKGRKIYYPPDIPYNDYLDMGAIVIEVNRDD